MRTSRISLPQSSRFVMLHMPLIFRFGKAEAAVISALDFLDRAQQKPNQPLANPSRIVSDLAGIIGRDAVLKAIKSLEDIEVIKSYYFTHPGKNNLVTNKFLSLNAEKLNEILNRPQKINKINGDPETSNSGNSCFQESPELLNSDLKPELNSELVSVIPTILCTKKEKAAEAEVFPYSSAEILPFSKKNAAASFCKKKQTRPSGILTWDLKDAALSQKIESEHPTSIIQNAILSLRIKKKEPLPAAALP